MKMYTGYIKFGRQHDWGMRYIKFRADVIHFKRNTRCIYGVIKRLEIRLKIAKDESTNAINMTTQVVVAFITALATLFATEKLENKELMAALVVGLTTGIMLAAVVLFVRFQNFKRICEIHFYEEVINILKQNMH